VASKVTKIEVDEVFQGQSTIILGSVAKGSNYLLGLQKCVDRTKEHIEGFLRPIAKRCMNVKVVITDLYSGYKTSISYLFQKAVHLVCHLHAGRILRRSVRHLGSVLSHHKKKLEQLHKAYNKLTKQIAKITARLDFLTDRLNTDQQTYKTLSRTLRTTQSKHTKTLIQKVDALAHRMKKDKEEQKLLKEKVSEKKKFLKSYDSQTSLTKKKISEANQDLLQSSRLVNDFVRLLRDFSPRFMDHKAKFQARLEASKYSMAKEILKMIQDNPALFSVRNPRVLGWNFQNTNTIEGIFAQFRRLLHATRLLSTEEGCERYCALFRLYHNTMPPFTGPHQKESPVERLGVNLHGKTYLDLLFPLRHRITHFFVNEFISQNHDLIPYRTTESAQCHILCA
jgi:transposase-like protein